MPRLREMRLRNGRPRQSSQRSSRSTPQKSVRPALGASRWAPAHALDGALNDLGGNKGGSTFLPNGQT